MARSTAWTHPGGRKNVVNPSHVNVGKWNLVVQHCASRNERVRENEKLHFLAARKTRRARVGDWAYPRWSADTMENSWRLARANKDEDPHDTNEAPVVRIEVEGSKTPPPDAITQDHQRLTAPTPKTQRPPGRSTPNAPPVDELAAANGQQYDLLALLKSGELGAAMGKDSGPPDEMKRLLKNASGKDLLDAFIKESEATRAKYPALNALVNDAKLSVVNAIVFSKKLRVRKEGFRYTVNESKYPFTKFKLALKKDRWHIPDDLPMFVDVNENAWKVLNAATEQYPSAHNGVDASPPQYQDVIQDMVVGTPEPGAVAAHAQQGPPQDNAGDGAVEAAQRAAQDNAGDGAAAPTPVNDGAESSVIQDKVGGAPETGADAPHAQQGPAQDNAGDGAVEAAQRAAADGQQNDLLFSLLKSGELGAAMGKDSWPPDEMKRLLKNASGKVLLDEFIDEPETTKATLPALNALVNGASVSVVEVISTVMYGDGVRKKGYEYTVNNGRHPFTKVKVSKFDDKYQLPRGLPNFVDKNLSALEVLNAAIDQDPSAHNGVNDGAELSVIQDKVGRAPEPEEAELVRPPSLTAQFARPKIQRGKRKPSRRRMQSAEDEPTAPAPEPAAEVPVPVPGADAAHAQQGPPQDNAGDGAAAPTPVNDGAESSVQSLPTDEFGLVDLDGEPSVPDAGGSWANPLFNLYKAAAKAVIRPFRAGEGGNDDTRDEPGSDSESSDHDTEILDSEEHTHCISKLVVALKEYEINNHNKTLIANGGVASFYGGVLVLKIMMESIFNRDWHGTTLAHQLRHYNAPARFVAAQSGGGTNLLNKFADCVMATAVEFMHNRTQYAMHCMAIGVPPQVVLRRCLNQKRKLLYKFALDHRNFAYARVVNTVCDAITHVYNDVMRGHGRYAPRSNTAAFLSTRAAGAGPDSFASQRGGNPGLRNGFGRGPQNSLGVWV